MKCFFLNLVILLAPLCSLSQNTGFSFPFCPNDKEWKEFNDVQERIDALQIPDSLIKDLSTKELLGICLDFPYYSDFMFADSFQKGLILLSREFNGFQALLSRKNLLPVLMEKANEHLSVLEKGKRWSHPFEKSEYAMKALLLDVMITQNIYTTEENLIDSLYISRKKFIINNPEVLGTLYRTGVECLRQNFLVKSSTDGWDEASVYTPNGTVVPYTYRWIGSEEDYDLNDSLYLSNQLATNYNGAQLLGMPTKKYNCHGYAWHVSEGGDYVWVGLKRNSIVGTNTVWTLSGSEASNFIVQSDSPSAGQCTVMKITLLNSLSWENMNIKSVCLLQKRTWE